MTLLANENSAGGSNAEATGWYPAIGGATQANGGSGGIDLYRETFRARLEKLALGSQPGVTAGESRPRRRWLSVSRARARAAGHALPRADERGRSDRGAHPPGVRGGPARGPLLLVNQNPYPVLVQAWVDDGALDGEPDTALAPFLPLPPVFRLEPGRQRSLRLLATGQAQARDRESLYWLNIYEIPASHRRGRWPAPAHGHPANPDEGAVPPARPASAR